MSKTIISSPKPTTILTGFLGSGKTTYLNHILERNADFRFAIIENEYGEQGIDSELILRAENDIVELNNGCLCCTLNENLYDILNSLYIRREEYDKLVIEATGVADPRGLAAPFLNNPAIKKQFPLRQVICLVDAEQIERQLKDTEEAIHQITFSDVLLVNKVDLVSKSHVEHLAKRLSTLNPLAQLVFSDQAALAISELQGRNSSMDDEVFNKCVNVESSSDKAFPVQKQSARHHHDHTDGVVSQTLFFDRPFDYQKLHLRLLGFLTFQAKDLYRMKGLIWLKDSDEQHLLQSVGPRLAIDIKRHWHKEEKRSSKIVVIGKGFQKKSLERMFSQCFSS